MKLMKSAIRGKSLALFIVTLLCVTNAFASGTTQGVLSDLYGAVFKPLNDFQKLLEPYGIRLIFSLLVLHIMAGGLMFWAGTTDMFDLVIKGIQLGIVGSLALASVTKSAWLGVMTGLGGEVTLTQAIMSGFDALAVLAGPAGPWMDLSGSNRDGLLFVHVVQGMLKTLTDLLNVPFYSPNSSVLEKAVNVINPVMWIAAAYWIASILMYVLACGVMLLELIGAELTIKFATVFAPLLVPWVLFKPMSFLFSGWLRALLIGGMGFLVALLMISGFASFITEAGKIISTNTTDAYLLGSGAALTFLPVLLGCFIFFLLAPKANNIASALISGSGVDGIGLHTLGHAMKAANAMASAPKQLAGSASNAARAVTSSIAGKGGRALNAGKEAYASSKGGMMEKSMSAARSSLKASLPTSSPFNSKVIADSLRKSPGGKATSDVAKATGKDKSLSTAQYKESSGLANSAFNQTRAEGGSVAASKVAAQKAASSYMTGIEKNNNPKTDAPQVAPPRRLTPSMIKGSA